MSFDITPLGDLLGEKGYIRGPFGSALKRAELKHSGIPVYEQQHAIRGDRDFRYYIDEKKYKKLKRFTIETNDLIISCSGTVGRISIIDKDDPKGIISQALLILRPNTEKISSLFLYYFLTSKKGFNELINASQGAVQLNIAPRAVVEKIPVPTPSSEVQQRIVYILRSLDDKIALNRHINQTLEAMAQAIFKSWFVDFEPVKAKIAALETGEDAEGITRTAMRAISGKTDDEYDQLQAGQPEHYAQLKTTAELFPSAMQDSEFGDIPEGWEVVDLKELSKTISKGTTPSKKQVIDAKGAQSISFIKVKDIANDGQIDRAGLELIHESIHKGALKRSMLEENDLLFSIAGTIGRVSIVENDLHNSNTNQAVAFIRLNRQDHLSLVLEHLKSKRIQESAMASVVQGVQANVSLTSVGSFQIIVPKGPILAAWNEVALSLHTEKLERQKQNRLLSQVRNTLLPKLLSGELEVNTVNNAES